MSNARGPNNPSAPESEARPGDGSSLPRDVTDWLRGVFGRCNRRITSKLCNNPNAPEESFDLTWIEQLSEYASPVQINDSWVVRVDAHYLGGLRHFMGWEIADIGLLLFIRRKGSLTTRKVAVLQSKRLYPTNSLVREEHRIDYEIGFARIADPEDLARSIATSTEFEFDEQCKYGALSAGSDQFKAIERYRQENGIPVHYQFYNPHEVPFAARVPATGRIELADDPPLGVRVMRAADVHGVLRGLPEGAHPTLAQLRAVDGYGSSAGWSLQEFVVDLFVGCREGTHFQSVNDPKMYNLFNRRSGPISAAIAVTIEET